jgi:K+-sensing histidine kinase KdpD
MTFNQITVNPTQPDTPMVKAGEENQLVSSEQRKEELLDLIISLSHKVDELAQVNEKFFQMIESDEKEFDSDDPGSIISLLKIAPHDAFTDPVLVYRLSSLMDFFKPTLDFVNWGVFLLTQNDSDIISLVSSSTSTEDEVSEDFTDKVKAQWESGNVAQAIAQKRRMVLPTENGNLLIIPFKVLNDKDGIWALQLKKGVSVETKSSADFPFGVDLVTTCIENSYLKKCLHSEPEAKSYQLEGEKLFTVTQLSRGMVHEINNYLQIILGRVQIARIHQNKSPESSYNVNIWETIEKNANRVCATIKSFSDFLHRQSDGLANTTQVNFQHILESNLDLLKYLLKSHQIELEQRLDDNLPVVSGEPGELEQAYLSLIWGMSDYLTSGGDIRLQASKENESLCLSAYWAEKKSKKDKFSDTVELQNNKRFNLVSQILKKNHGSIKFEELSGEEKRIVLRFPIAKNEIEDIPMNAEAFERKET